MKIEGSDQGRSLTDPWELEGTHDFSAETLLATIMMKGAQLEPLWSDPVFFYRMNNQWWLKWKGTFEAWCTVLEKEYEPLWDRNSFEDIIDHETSAGTLDTNTTGKEVVDDDTTGHSNTENKVSAFDSNTYQPHDTSSTSTSGTDDRTTNTTGKIDTDTSGVRDYTHSLHTWGNAGISMTSQKLLKQELEVRYWNIYNVIADIFLDELAVRVF